MTGVISSTDETMVQLFSGLNPRLFAKLVRQLRREACPGGVLGLRLAR